MADATKHPVRPFRKPRKYDRRRIAEEFARYIENTPVPIAAEFAASQGAPKSVLYDWPELEVLLKLCATKKEGALERGLLEGKLIPSGAIFSLKQLGWSDRLIHAGDITAPIPLTLTGSDIRG